jgi:Na+-transporting methylmalonyl-CoA/oxaloacetate decarboxylase gamma subunit
MQIIGLNTLDLLLIVILFVGVLVGIIRGALAQIFSIVSIWFGLLLTLWFYKPFSIHILQGLNMPKTGSDTMAFLILLVVFFNGIRFFVKRMSTPPEERKQKKKSKEDPLAEAAKSVTQRFVIGPLNMLGGAVTGFILTALWITLVLAAIQFIFQPTEIGGSYSGPKGITTNLRTSTLVPLFNRMLLLLSQSVSLFIPKNADFLKKVLDFISID